MVWEIVFMLLILKIPLVYVCVVVWWAIKSEPTPPTSRSVSSPTRPRRVDRRGGSRDGHRRPLRPHAPGLGGGSASPRSPARGRDGVRA